MFDIKIGKKFFKNWEIFSRKLGKKFKIGQFFQKKIFKSFNKILGKF
jgi:hypothetical protein